jgi:hypothetical protein
MGSRSRRRTRQQAPAAQRTSQPARLADVRPRAPIRFERRAHRATRPLGPWGRFPITEITIACGIVIMGLAFSRGDGPRSPHMVAGAGVCAAGALELTVREHIAGYRSHTLLLSFLPVVTFQGLLNLTGVASVLQAAAIAVDFACFAVLFQVWQAIYRRASKNE